jgi:hypothetical protein
MRKRPPDCLAGLTGLVGLAGLVGLVVANLAAVTRLVAGPHAGSVVTLQAITMDIGILPYKKAVDAQMPPLSSARITLRSIRTEATIDGGDDMKRVERHKNSLPSRRAACLISMTVATVALWATACNNPSTNDGPQKSEAKVGTAQQALQPTCITIQRGTHGDVADAKIIDQLPAANYGSDDRVSVGKVIAGEHRTLIRFDLGEVPPNVQITEATLRVTNVGGDNDPTVRAHRALVSWVENQVTWPSFYAANPAHDSAIAATGAASGSTMSFNIKDLVQLWVDGTPNNGVLLEKSVNQPTNFASSEWSTVASRPSLTVCFACAPNTGDCNNNVADGCETNLNTDVSHCGTCGTACSYPNAGASCSGGACQMDACTAGFDNCDGQTANGCETPLNTLTSCGACGVACSRDHATATCATGSCQIDSCTAGFDNCDGTDGNGCETPLNTLTNCGTCGAACSTANATPTCATGSCQIDSCNAGFGDCDSSATTGCETALNTLTNCGACGAGCAFDNASASCATGTCAFVACNGGFANCDSNPANGCEIDVNTNANHCGSCGHVCSLPNANAMCASGGCQIASCNAGFADCDGVAANGCEVNLNTDVAHCGTCATACAFENASATCSNGSCQLGTCNVGFRNCDNSPGNGCERTEASIVPEVCDGVDNNCDGVVDNGIVSQTCNTGEAGPCKTGSTSCVNGAEVCSHSLPQEFCVEPPIVTIDSPAGGTVTSIPTIQVMGHTDQPCTVTVAGVEAAVTGLDFNASVTLKEGDNVLAVEARAFNGGTGAASVVVRLDTSKPRVTIDTPLNNVVVATPFITVTGTVQDQVVGSVNGGNITVVVNGINATVENRGFRALDVPVAEGKSTITVVAADGAGNTGSAVIEVTRDPSPKGQIVVVSGELQNPPPTVGTAIGQPLVAKVTDNTGAAVENAPVTFAITRGDGSFPGLVRTVTVLTNAQGLASTGMTVGSRAAVASDVVEATSTGYIGTATFALNAAATLGGDRRLSVLTGANQSAPAGGLAPEPLTVLLSDEFGNPIAGQNVTFTVLKGNGLVNANPFYTVATDGNGRAFTLLTAGPLPGINSQIVEVSAANALQARFVASTLEVGSPVDTTFSGVVMTNQNAPVPNVRVVLHYANPQTPPLWVLTDAEGRFTFPNANNPNAVIPTGNKVHLEIDGTTAGPYPPLNFEEPIVEGTDTVLRRPVYLPLVDSEGLGTANADTDVVLQRSDVPGLVFTVPAGSATFTGGAKSGVVQIIRVNRDKIPMVPPDGVVPTVAFAIMPAAVTFDPPAPIRFPNTEGRKPGEIVTIYSYDHDLSEFIGVGTAQVSADGQHIVSGPGQGIVKGGWHLTPPAAPPPPTCAATNTCRAYVCNQPSGGSADCYKCGRAAPNTCANGIDPSILGECGVATPTALNTLGGNPSPDAECYDCPSNIGGIVTSCTVGTATGCAPGAAMPLKACTRRYDANDPGSTPGPTFTATGVCRIPTIPAGNALPVCCPLGQECTIGGGVGDSVCCDSASYCENGTGCLNLKPNGAACTAPVQCVSKNCVGNVCTP